VGGVKGRAPDYPLMNGGAVMLHWIA
jgi:hypothetical protein